MNFRVVYISNICKLSCKYNNLVVSSNNTKTNIPLADISVLLIENLYSNITTKLLSHLTQNKITTIICDESHLPNGVLLPFNGKVRMLESYKYQANIKDKFKNNMWDKIIKNKIYNQGLVLEYANKEDVKILMDMQVRVKLGDINNIEAQVSQLYWKMIFKDNFHYFTRNMQDIRNSALNYGYAILRSIIANILSCKGFVLYDGLHHKSELNQFNLVDDIIEPFRAFVEFEVYKIFEEEYNTQETLDKELKKRLLGIVDSVAYIKKQKFSLINAIDKYCDSVYNCYKYKDENKLLDITLDIWK